MNLKCKLFVDNIVYNNNTVWLLGHSYFWAKKLFFAS